MKLGKSLLLGSAAALAATVGAQAADLPMRKSAPVDYVRVCDWTGAGYFYIPGSDTCMNIGGLVRAEYAFVNNARLFTPGAGTFSVGNSTGGNGGNSQATGIAGVFTPGRNRDQSGFFIRGRIAVDTRTQTAYGTLRAYVRYQSDNTTGNYGADGGQTTPGGSHNTTYLDKGFIQFAGFTAGRIQSYFDFYADNYNYDGIANSDESNEVLAYTYTAAGGFSATISLENADGARRDGIGNFFNGAAQATPTSVAYSGQTVPDVVGQLNVSQAWGQAQLSAAYHNVNTQSASLGEGGQAFLTRDTDGFAVQGGVQFKLPMLAAGDDLWIEGAYQQGAYLYQDSDGNMNQGFYNPIIGGFSRQDHDAYAIQNGNGTYSLALSRGYSVMAAINHYFTPNFHDVLYGSYEHSDYGNRAAAISWTQGGIAGAEQFKVGNQFLWDPVKNLEIGIDVMYSRIDQKIPGEYTALNGVPAVALPVGVTKDPDSFMARLRVERDF